MTDGPKTFHERRRDAALAEQDRINTRDAAVADIVRGKQRYQVTDVIAIEDGDGATTGAFVAKVDAGKNGLGTYWAAVNNGQRLFEVWIDRPLAILHLLGVRYGDSDGASQAAHYAARVLGIDHD